jgi:hypothetical protein
MLVFKSPTAAPTFEIILMDEEEKAVAIKKFAGVSVSVNNIRYKFHIEVDEQNAPRNVPSNKP